MGLFAMPFRGLVRVFEEIAERAERELHDEDAIQAALTELYRKLEAGAISEEEFGDREADIVERLERIAAREPRGGRCGGG